MPFLRNTLQNETLSPNLMAKKQNHKWEISLEHNSRNANYHSELLFPSVNIVIFRLLFT